MLFKGNKGSAVVAVHLMNRIKQSLSLFSPSSEYKKLSYTLHSAMKTEKKTTHFTATQYYYIRELKHFQGHLRCI